MPQVVHPQSFPTISQRSCLTVNVLDLIEQILLTIKITREFWWRENLGKIHVLFAVLYFLVYVNMQKI